jgi:hypothetical protein
MKNLLENFSSIGKFCFKRTWDTIVFACFLLHNESNAQLANYINNGSFEDYYDCNSPYPLSKAKYWLPIDSASVAGMLIDTCNLFVPVNPYGYQFPRTGHAQMGSTFFCLNPLNVRGYFKNRLKGTLKTGKTYCVKFHVNITDQSPRGMDGFGIYFGNNAIDTITKCNVPLTYINPQVKNPPGNVIIDTMNWVPITGTFVANGTEKYALLGNFLADNVLSTVSLTYSPFYPQSYTDVLIDDVSCMDIDLPAFAGNDTSCIPGTTIYIGRQRDVGIDEACMWYKLPNLTTAIDNAAGLWVSPLVTTTYVVRQEICGNVKWDTIVVHQTAVGLNELSYLIDDLKIYPVPAQDKITLQFTTPDLEDQFKKMSIYNNLGQLMREEVPRWLSGSKNKTATISINDFEDGVYFLRLVSINSQTVSKRFMIAR